MESFFRTVNKSIWQVEEFSKTLSRGIAEALKTIVAEGYSVSKGTRGSAWEANIICGTRQDGKLFAWRICSTT